VDTDQNGHLYIGDISYENGNPVSQRPVEMTSQGANLNGIDAYLEISAGYACHMYDGSGDSIYSVSSPDGAAGVARDTDDDSLAKRASHKMTVMPVFTPESGISHETYAQMKKEGRVYITGNNTDGKSMPYTMGIVYDEPGIYSSPITNIYDGATIGYRYLQFGDVSPSSVTVRIKAISALGSDGISDTKESASPVTIRIHIDEYHGEVISEIKADISAVESVIPLGLKDGWEEYTGELTVKVTGKHAVYFEFVSDDKEQAFAFDAFTFDR